MGLTCDRPGCDKGPATTGDGLLRVNPTGKGQGFTGLCFEHYGMEFDEMLEDIAALTDPEDQ